MASQIYPVKDNLEAAVIGEIRHVTVDPNSIWEDGYTDIEFLDSIAISDLDNYHATQRLKRMTYTKPDQKPKVL